MSATVRVLTHVEVNLGGEWVEIGSRETPVEVSITGEKFEVIAQLTNAADGEAGDYVRQTLWTSGDGGIDDLDVLVAQADGDCLLEIRSDASPTQYSVHQLYANVPFVLAADEHAAADAGSSVLADSTDPSTSLNSIDLIAAQNPDDEAGTVTIRLLILT